MGDIPRLEYKIKELKKENSFVILSVSYTPPTIESDDDIRTLWENILGKSSLIIVNSGIPRPNKQVAEVVIDYVIIKDKLNHHDLASIVESLNREFANPVHALIPFIIFSPMRPALNVLNLSGAITFWQNKDGETVYLQLRLSQKHRSLIVEISSNNQIFPAGHLIATVKKSPAP